jgi:WD40 repeat protein
MAKKKKRARGNAGPGGQAAAPPLPPGVKLLRTLEGHSDAVLSVAFDPQGGTLASGSDDTTVKLWDARSGKLVRALYGHHGGVASVAFDKWGQPPVFSVERSTDR